MMVRSCCAMQDRSLVLQRLLEAEVVVESESIIIVVVLYRRHDFVASNCLAWCTQSVHMSVAAEELSTERERSTTAEESSTERVGSEAVVAQSGSRRRRYNNK